MAYLRRPRGFALVALASMAGLLAGLLLGGFHWGEPIHAWSTDRTDNFIMATGPVDGEVEAVYFLDCLTGALSGRVLSNQTKNFQASYQVSVQADLSAVIEIVNKQVRAENQSRKRSGPPRPEIQLPQTPKYMMVTGLVDIRRGSAARMRPAASAVYVAEANTGILLTYILPWSAEKHSANMPDVGKLVLWAGDQVTVPVVGQ